MKTAMKAAINTEVNAEAIANMDAEFSPELFPGPARSAWLCRLVLSCLIIVVGSRLAMAESIELLPVLDNTLFETSDGGSSSGRGPFLFFGSNSQSSSRRALLVFDFDAIAVGSTIDSVSLRIHVSQAPNETPQPVTVHTLLASWGEGASAAQGGSGAPSEDGDATWLHRFFPDSLWSSAGGDFSSETRATEIVGSVGFLTLTGSGLAADVSNWLAQPESSYGWLLQGNESEPSSARRIDSREAADSTLWPRLTVHFTEPVPTRSISWGRLKSLLGGR